MNLESTELDIRVSCASAKCRRFSERSDYFSIPAAKRAFRFKFSKRNADTKPMAESTDMAIKQFIYPFNGVAVPAYLSTMLPESV